MPLQCPRPVYKWHVQQVAIILNKEPDTFFPPKWSSFGNSRAKDKQQQVMAMNTRALTDRSFYSKLFHPPSDWTYYEEIQTLTPNPDPEPGILLDTQEIYPDNLEESMENLHRDQNLLDDHQNTEGKGSAALSYASINGEESSVGGDQQVIIKAISSLHQSKEESFETELQAQQHPSLNPSQNVETGRGNDTLADAIQNELMSTNYAFNQQRFGNMDDANTTKNDDAESHTGQANAGKTLDGDHIEHDSDEGHDNLLDFEEIGPANVKGKLGSQAENANYAMYFQEDQKAKEITDNLMLLSSSSNQETFETGVDHGIVTDCQRSHQVINGTTNRNNYQHEPPETELETQCDFPLERDEYVQYGSEQESLVDKDQNEVIGHENSNPVINDDENKEWVMNRDYAQGYQSSDENSDTKEEEDRNFDSDHGDVNDNGEHADNNMQDEKILNTNTDGEDDDDDDLDKTGSNYQLSLRNNAGSYEKEGKYDLDRGLGKDGDHDIHQTKAQSFLGLLSGSGSDSDSEKDFNF